MYMCMYSEYSACHAGDADFEVVPEIDDEVRKIVYGFSNGTTKLLCTKDVFHPHRSQHKDLAHASTLVATARPDGT